MEIQKVKEAIKSFRKENVAMLKSLLSAEVLNDSQFKKLSVEVDCLAYILKGSFAICSKEFVDQINSFNETIIIKIRQIKSN